MKFQPALHDASVIHTPKFVQLRCWYCWQKV